MRALALTVLLLGGLAARADAQVARADTPVTLGFDHNVHDRDVVVSGAESLPCTRCHEVRNGVISGKPGHATCFGACHGPAPTLPKRGAALAITPERMELCTSCHLEETVRTGKDRRAFKVAFPPYTLYRDFALQIGHQQHAAMACTQCHAERRGAAHRRCLTCHDGSQAGGKGPAMSACRSCHEPASGTPDQPALLRTVATQIVVTTAFSHAKHATRSAAGGRCLTCHAAIPTTNDRQLPRPTMQSCAGAGCHGGGAFPITEACTKCHQDVPTTKFDVARPSTRFSHVAHLPRLGGALACASCHRTTGRGTEQAGEVIVAGHAACASCHAADFAAREPKICGACHNSTEPWRPLIADVFPAARSELGAKLDHTKHRAACTTCHTLTTATVQLRPARGHRACSTQGCHAIAGGPAPQLGHCDGCH
ncbi:MAG: cytochrome c family protein, partial [Myxococcota bacterium]|nr:cytochrome c family protein [Myxococcota bacterium]